MIQGGICKPAGKQLRNRLVCMQGDADPLSRGSARAVPSARRSQKLDIRGVVVEQ